MSVVVQVPVELGPYLDELVQQVSRVAALDAVYLVGSAAYGAYDDGRSDVDVVAVTAQPLGEEEKHLLVAAAEAIPCPGRKLELVVYPRGSDRWQVNLNTGEHVGFDADAEPSFWFVIDRAIAQEHAVPLLGPAWLEVFDPVPREQVIDAVAESLEWQEHEDPLGRSSVLNATRALMWLETGAWHSKPDAAAWLRSRVRERLEEER